MTETETPTFGEMSFEDALRAVMTGKEAPQEGPAAPVVAPVVTTQPVENAPTATAATTSEDASAARIARILERERALAEREAAYTSWEAEKQQLTTRASSIDELKAQFKRNPREFLRTFDPDLKPIDLANELFTEELGDNAPPEYRAKVQERRIQQMVAERTSEIEKKFEARFAQVEAVERASRLQQYEASVQSAMATSTEHDLVKKFATTAPDRALKAAILIAEKAAATGTLLTPAQVTSKLNEELATLRTLFVSESTPAAPAVTTPTKSDTTTLRNSDSQTVASKNPDDDEVLFWAAIDAAKKVRAQLNPA